MNITYKRLVTVSLLALLVAAPLTSAQNHPPPPPSSATPPARAPATASASPSPPAATTPPPAAATSPPVRAPQASPPTSATTAAAAAGTARPAVAPATSTPVMPSIPSSAPRSSATALNTLPATGPAGSSPAMAPGASTGTANVSLIMTSAPLGSPQQTQLCQGLVSGVQSVAPGVTQCTVTSQAVTPQRNFHSRRLNQQANIFALLTVVLSLGSVNPSQLSGIQGSINNLRLNVTSNTSFFQVVTPTVLSITFVNAPLTPTTAVMPANTPALPPSATITLSTAPAGAPVAMATVVMAAPPNATVNTTANVPATQAQAPAPPSNGTTTTTTITNTTHTTTLTTIAYPLASLVAAEVAALTAFEQFVFTVLLGQSTGLFSRVNFQLAGNLAFNVPTTITGGAMTGSKATFAVTGATVTQVTATTFTSTTTTTTTTGGNGGTGGTGTGTATTANALSQVKYNNAVPQNPYGVMQILANEGTLVKGAFLVSSWNDNVTTADIPAGNPGNGRIIYQAFPNGTTTVWANITVTGACKNQAGAGGVVGVTMALSRCGSVIIVGSLPIPGGAAGTALPGCLIALDTSGNVLNEVTDAAINGPWGSVCTASNGQITYALSSVLGGLASSTSTTGRKLLQQAPAMAPSTAAATTANAFVVRFTFATPTKGSTWSLGNPTFLVQNISTGGVGGVQGGNVAPGGLTADDQGNIFAPDLLGNRLLKVSNGFSTTSSGYTVLNTSQPLNGPNSLSFNNGNLLGVNALDGNIFQVTLDSGRNGGNTILTQVVPNSQGTNGGGVNFNIIASTDSTAGAAVGSLWFPNDNNSTLNTISSITG